MWEDSPHGGIWITKIRKEEDVDSKWEALMISLISDHFQEQSVIGITLSLRARDRLV